MLNKKKILSFIYFSLALLPLVSAQPFAMRGNFAFMIEDFFNSFFDIIGRDMVLTGIVFILFFVLQYSIFGAAAKRVKIFSGEKGLNNQGLGVVIAFSGLSTIGIFYGFKNEIVETVQRILTMGGTLGILLLAISIFLLIYYKTNLKDGKNIWLGVVAAGITIIILSYIIGDGWFLIGAIIALIGVIGLIFQAVGLFNNLTSGGSSGGSGGKKPKEKYCEVNSHVTDGTGNNIAGAKLQAKYRYRGWRDKGFTDVNGICHFNTKSGMRSIRATHNGIVGGGRFNLMPGITNNCPIIIGAGPGGSGRIYGTVEDETGKPLQGIKVEWNGLKGSSNDKGHYNIVVPTSKFGNSNLNATDTYYYQDSPIIVDLNPTSPSQDHDIIMKPLSPVNVKIEYDYGGGVFTDKLISNQTGVTVKIKANVGGFNPGSGLNTFILYNSSDKVIQIITETTTPKLEINAANDEFTINNLDTTNCSYVRYFFN